MGTADGLNYHASDEDDVTETVSIHTATLLYGSPDVDTVPRALDHDAL